MREFLYAFQENPVIKPRSSLHSKRFIPLRWRENEEAPRWYRTSAENEFANSL